jgi:hypothetical protein
MSKSEAPKKTKSKALCIKPLTPSEKPAFNFLYLRATDSNKKSQCIIIFSLVLYRKKKQLQLAKQMQIKAIQKALTVFAECVGKLTRSFAGCLAPCVTAIQSTPEH